jgi:hypothetical protein
MMSVAFDATATYDSRLRRQISRVSLCAWCISRKHGGKYGSRLPEPGSAGSVRLWSEPRAEACAEFRQQGGWLGRAPLRPTADMIKIYDLNLGSFAFKPKRGHKKISVLLIGDPMSIFGARRIGEEVSEKLDHVSAIMQGSPCLRPSTPARPAMVRRACQWCVSRPWF